MRLPRAPKLAETRGQSLVEMALLLPLLLLLALGIFDFSRAIQANNIIANLSREGANLISRTSNSADDIMASLAATAQPLAMGKNGKMYVTEVKKVEGATRIEDVQSWGTGGPGSRVDGANPGAILGTINLEEDQSVYIFEVFYKYDCMFVKPASIQLYSSSIF